MEKEEVDPKLAQIGKDRHWLAEAAGYTYDTLKNRLAPNAKPLSFAMSRKIEEAFKDHEKNETGQSVIECHPDESELKNWLEADLVEAGKFTDFAISRINKLAQNINSVSELDLAPPSKITQLPKKKANIMAAAGPGIMAEVTDWDGEDDIVRVKICGDSMFPLFEDGQVIEMKHKRASRSPYMAKGLIYLVQLEGEWMVKRYDTRKPRADEKDAEYLTGTKMVGILKSENPDFEDIDITGPFEWAAWLDQ